MQQLSKPQHQCDQNWRLRHNAKSYWQKHRRYIWHRSFNGQSCKTCLLHIILLSKEHCIDQIMPYPKIRSLPYSPWHIENWLPDCLIFKLQRVQKATAWLVVHCHRWEQITPVLIKLQWLALKRRVQYAILLLAFRAQHGLVPPYITNLLEQRATRVLRLTFNNDLYMSSSRSWYGDRISSVFAPRL